LKMGWMLVQVFYDCNILFKVCASTCKTCSIKETHCLTCDENLLRLHDSESFACKCVESYYEQPGKDVC
jgi:hypothetical protein